jgi:hypothetical protein
MMMLSQHSNSNLLLPLCIFLFAMISTTIVPSSSAYTLSKLIPRAFRPPPFHRKNSPVCRKASTLTRSGELQQDDSWGGGVQDDGPNEEDDGLVDDEDIEFLFEEPEVPYKDLAASEKVWRHAKKPLLRIGAKGATHSHGNSLRQLLEDHTVVKVKVNTRKFGKHFL